MGYLCVQDALVMIRSCLTRVPVQTNLFLSPGCCSTIAAIQQYRTVLVTSPAIILKTKNAKPMKTDPIMQGCSNHCLDAKKNARQAFNTRVGMQSYKINLDQSCCCFLQ